MISISSLSYLKRLYLHRIIFVLFLYISMTVSAESNIIFRAIFDRLNPEKYTVAGFGRTQRQGDRALVLARTGAEEFHAEAAPAVKIPTGDYQFKLKTFPTEGFFELYACPFSDAPGIYPLAELRKQDRCIVSLVIKDRQLIISIHGKTISINIRHWIRHHYRHIQLVWKDKGTEIYIERQLVGKLSQVPAMADNVRLSADFQGLVDEVTVGSGIPLVIDPEFDGNLKNFPVIRSSLEVKAPENWKFSDDLAIVEKGKMLDFHWQGDQNGKGGAIAECLSCWPVSGGEFIRGDFTWTKNTWEYASQMHFRLNFYDVEGRKIKSSSIDGKIVNHPKVMGNYIPMLLSETGTESAIGVPLHYFNYYQVPEKASYICFSCICSGNPLSFSLQNVSFRKIDSDKTPWFREPFTEQKIHSLVRLNRTQVDQVLRERIRAIPELRRIGDRIEVFVNNSKKPLHIVNQPLAGNYRWIDGFRKAGFPFYVTVVTIGRRCDYTESPQVWKENGEIDISVMENAVRRIIRQNPEAMVFLNLSICPSRSWLENNRKELMINQRGEYAVVKDYAIRGQYSRTFPDKPGYSWYPSTASVKYREDMGAILTRALRAFEKTDAAKAVVGIYVTGGDDGQFRFPPLPDFSRPALISYRNFLKSLGRKNADLAEMPDPYQFNRPPFPKVGDSVMADYWRWSTQVSYELRQYMYDVVKQAMPRVLVGGYENGMGLTGQPGFGRYKITELLKSRAPDFMISLPGYNRYRDDCDHPSGMKAYNGSMLLHKKLMIGEMDIRNPEMGPLGINNRSRNWQATHNACTFRNFLALYGSYCFSWGGGFHAYIMQPLWYNTEEAMSSWQRAVKITGYSEGQELDEYRIGVFMDENSAYFNATKDVKAFFTRIHYKESLEYSLWRSGVRCDYYVPADIFHPDLKIPKIMIFGDAGTMTQEQAAQIRARFGNQGRLLIWIGHAGYLPKGDVDTVKEITGFNVFPRKIKKSLVDLNGKILWEPAFYAGGYPEPAWVIDDPRSRPLAFYAGTDLVGMAEKKYQEHTEIYLGQPGSLSPDIVRALARRVGIIPVQNQNDLAVMGGGLLEIGAMTGPGKRKIYYPNGVRNLVCLTGQKILEKGQDFLVIDLPYKDAAVFKMER